MGRGMEGQEMTISGGNKGGKREKHGREGRRKGGSPARRPLCKQGTWTRRHVVDLKHGEIGEYSPHTLRTVLGQSPVGT
jgi:hypothetical protein